MNMGKLPQNISIVPATPSKRGRGVYTMKLWGFVIVLVLLAQTGYAVDLSQMQQMALGNRKVIQRYMINLDKSEKDITKAKAGYLPSANVSYTVNSHNRQTLTEAKQNSVAYGAVTMNLFSGFRDKYTIQSAQLMKQVETERLQGIRQDIQLNVALRYLEVYERKANLKVAEDAFTTLNKMYVDGENRLAVGMIGTNELLKFKVDLDYADISLKKASADLDISVLLLGREAESTIALSDLQFAEFNTPPAFGDPGASEARMLAERSEIKALKGLAEAARMQVLAAKSDYYPRVDLVGSYSKYDDNYTSGSGDIGSQGEDLKGQVVLSMNLFNGHTTESTVGKAQLEARGLQYDLQEMEETMKTTLKNLYIDYKVSLENIGVAEENISHAKENLRITQLKYNEGLQRESELLDAVTSLSRAQYNYVAVIRSAFLNHFQITRMIEGFAGE
jgi:outer membrane protein